MKLQFGKGNEKLDALAKKTGRPVYTFSLLSGHTCPYAKECKSSAIVGPDGRRHIEDGPHTQFRCFSASQEVIFTPVYKSRLENGEIVKLATVDKCKAYDIVASQLPKKLLEQNGILRLHVGGDFQTQAYFDVWNAIAAEHPNVTFYSYTKSLPFWVSRLEFPGIAKNLILTASYGGYRDDLIAKHKLRFVKVVYSTYEARKLKLPIDHDDSHAIKPDGNFALLIHGIQPAGSKAGSAVRRLNGKGSYGKKSRERQQLTDAQKFSIKIMDSIGW